MRWRKATLVFALAGTFSYVAACGPSSRMVDSSDAACPSLLEAGGGTIERALDGDSFIVSGCEVRLASPSIDAPESWAGSSKAERQARAMGLTLDELTEFGERAADYASRFEGAHVVLELDPANADTSHRDRYGRLLAEVKLGGESLNERLVRAGYALAYLHYNDASDRRYLLELEREARVTGRGLWADPVWRAAVRQLRD